MLVTNYGDSGPHVLMTGDGGTTQLREGDFLADRELALTKEGEVVEERDKRALSLLVAKGQVVRKEVAAQYGLRLEDGRVVWGPPTAPITEEPAEAEDPAEQKPARRRR